MRPASPETRALDIYNSAVAFAVASQIPSAQIKETAKGYALNQVARITAAFYECSDIDKFTPHRSISFYEDIRKIISNF